MRIWNVLFVMGAVVLVNGADVATAQDAVIFAVDGDPIDWGGAHGFDRFHEVTPDTNSTVDIRKYGFGWGEFGDHKGVMAPLPRELFAFILKFLAPPFQGSDPTTVELFFDASIDPAFGDLTLPWKEFRPDFRIGVTGQDGELTAEFYRRYVGGQWETTTGADITEVELALSGRWLEGAIPWPALGSPGGPAGSPEESLNFLWAVQVSKGMYRDYLPDDNWYDPWRPFEDYLTNVEATSWGKIKRGE